MTAVTGADHERDTGRRHLGRPDAGRPTRPTPPGRVTRLPAFVGKA